MGNKSSKMNGNPMPQRQGKHPLDFDSDDSFDLGPVVGNQGVNGQTGFGNFNNFKKNPRFTSGQNSMIMNPSQGLDGISNRSSMANKDPDGISDIED